MKALIFGINGQDGYYLRRLCEQKGIEVFGVSRSKGDWSQGDVADFVFVSEQIKSNKPDYIFHLAANSTTSHEALWDNHAAISTGSLNILESVKKFSPQSKVFLSGSGLQFENKDLPIKESDCFVATSPYVVSRNHSVYAARYYRALGYKIYVGYFFNHDSPRRPLRHMAQKIAHYCKTITGQTSKLEIGDITVKKEWAYAEDVIEGIFTLLNQEVEFEVCIGTGTAYSIEDWLDECFSMIGKDWKQYVIVRPSFIPEYRILMCDPSIINSLGWKPKTSFSDLARIMVEK